MAAWLSGISPPAPTPCSARNAISSPMLEERPHSAEPTRNTLIETTNSRRRP